MVALVVLLAAQRTVVAAVGDDAKKREKGVVLRVDGFDLSPFGSNTSSMYMRATSFYKKNYSFVDKAPHSAGFQEIQSIKKGNTIYLMPHKNTVKIPLSKFKVPTNTNQ